MNRDSLANFLVVAASAVLVVFGFWNGYPLNSPSAEGVTSAATTTKSATASAARAAIAPNDVRAVYITAQTASVPADVQGIIDLVKSTELNAVVVNVKDSDGTYLGAGMKRVVDELHKNGIYAIARIVVFQDNAFARAHPELALHDASGSLWYGGGSSLWVDPSSREAWDENVGVAVKALAMGFNEINFDYVRFPSGGVGNAVYPIYNGTSSMVGVIDDFFKYLTSRIRESYPKAILSVDIFAYSFIKNDGLGVGQRAAEAAKYFNVISPMVYPSHYAPGNFGFPNPAEEPYQVVFKTLEDGKKLLPASSTAIVRPWIQDFNMGAVYDTQMVDAEIQAVKDAGFGDTWMAWNPSNVYDQAKYLLK